MSVCALNAAIAMIALLAAAVQDIRSRLVDDRIWIVGVLIGLPATAYSLTRCGAPINSLQQIGAGLILTAILSASWRLKLMGEADVLAYLALEIIHPVASDSLLPPAFSTFLYSKVLMLAIPPVQLIVNLAKVRRDSTLLEGIDDPPWKKLLALALLTTNPSLGSVPAEEVRDGRRRLILSRILSPLEAKVPEDGESRWYVPAYPLIPLILLGYALSLLIGDPLGLLMRAP